MIWVIVVPSQALILLFFMILFNTNYMKAVECIQSFQIGEVYLHYRALEVLEVVYNMAVYEHFIVGGGGGGPGKGSLHS
jgi:hypothetical protein